MAGEHDDAISRVDDLIDTVQFNSVCYVVQACIYVARIHTMNIITDVSNRRTCFFSSETLAWQVVTSAMQYNCSSVRKTKPDIKPDTIQANHCWRSH